MSTCPVCASEVPPGARFCPGCGALQIAARAEERRVVTVAFADLVGFTSLSERLDPEQVKRLVDDVFQHLAADVVAFGGRVDKIVGDCLVALFGAPVAHEDDAERAVRAALRMQNTLMERMGGLDAPVDLRIGVNTGEVLVGALRAGGDYTAMGDVVNTAQRLQTMAPTGGVLVGPATHALTAEAISYRAQGVLMARGRDEPVEAWLALEPLTLPGRRRRRQRTPLVGRDLERRLLTDLLRLSAQRSRAVLAVVEGEGGAGKTRVVSDVVLRAGFGSGSTVLVGSCVPYGEANRWWPLASALAAALRVDQAAMTADATRRRLEEMVPGLTGRTGPEAVSLVDGLLHLFGHPSPVDAIDPGRARQEVTRAVLAVLQGLVERGPVTLVIADVHWADPIVLEVVAWALARLSVQPFAVVTTTRPELSSDWPPGGLRVAMLALRLGPLDRAASAELVRSLIGEETTEAVIDDLFQRSGGNPLFLEELATLVAAGDDGETLPDSLRALVAARLDQLPGEQRAMLDNAAVLGSSGHWQALEVFGEALGQPVSRSILDGLVDAGLLEADGDRWRFRSESVRDVAYGTITKADRAMRHCGVARALDQRHTGSRRLEEITHHWASAAELASGMGHLPDVPADIADRAVDALVVAADHALEQLFAVRAEELADRAFALVRDAARERRVLLVRAEARTEQRRVAEAQEDLERLLHGAQAAGDDVAEARALRVRGELHRQLGRYDLARDDLDRAAALLQTLGDRPALAETELAAGMNAIFSGAFPSAEAHLAQAEALFGELGDRRGSAWVDQHRAWVSFVQGDVDEADRRLGRAAAAMEELGDRGGLAWVMGLQAYVRFFQGRFEEAAALCAEVHREATERGDRWAAGMMITLRASLRLWTGRAEEATRLALDASSTFRELRDRFGEAQALTVAARSQVALGLGADAARTAESALAVAAGLGEASLVDLVAGSVELYRGDLRRAETLARRTIEESSSRGFAHEAEVTLGLSLLLQGRSEEASTVLDQAAEHRPGHPAVAAARALAFAAEGRPGDALGVLGERSASAPGTYLDRVLSGLGEAVSYAALGRDEAALAALEAARSTADPTDDVLARVITRLAADAVLRELGQPEAAEAEAAWAAAELDRLDVDLVPWARLFARAAGGVEPHAEVPA